MKIYTIGHSNRSFADFAALLAEHSIRILADIRTVPGSRHVPQFGREALQESLRALRPSIRYVHIPELGGLRKPRPDSVNTAWRVAGFRAYADYMQTPAFGSAVEELIGLAKRSPLAFMCAEAVPWRCHRNLLSDALTVRGAEVVHIMGPGKTQIHKLTPFALVSDDRITYPGRDAQKELWQHI